MRACAPEIIPTSLSLVKKTGKTHSHEEEIHDRSPSHLKNCQWSDQYHRYGCGCRGAGRYSDPYPKTTSLLVLARETEYAKITLNIVNDSTLSFPCEYYISILFCNAIFAQSHILTEQKDDCEHYVFSFLPYRHRLVYFCNTIITYMTIANTSTWRL